MSSDIEIWQRLVRGETRDVSRLLADLRALRELDDTGRFMFHSGEEAAVLWRRAHQEGIGHLLNLVADEHLERNLRAIDAEYGDRLKRLGAHAFLHSSREENVEVLLGVLLGGAVETLTTVQLGVAHDPACVEIASGALLRALDWREGSFTRFLRALRLGQGNRWNDPLVAKALGLFEGGFRRLDMRFALREGGRTIGAGVVTVVS